jgi:hypothetical protein
LNFKGTPSQEEHKTIFSSLKICKMALSNQIDFPAVFNPSDDLPEFNQFQNTAIRYRLCPIRWPYTAMFRKLTFPELTDCGNSM